MRKSLRIQFKEIKRWSSEEKIKDMGDRMRSPTCGKVLEEKVAKYFYT